jgi:hypothetical protein
VQIDGGERLRHGGGVSLEVSAQGRRGHNPFGIGELLVWWTQGRPAVQANPGLGGAIPLGLGNCWGMTQGRPAVQANPGLGDAIPLGLVRRCQFDWWAYS